MHQTHMVAVVWIIVSAVVGGAVAAFVVLAAQRRMHSGEAMDQWQRVRRQLSPADRWRVNWATARQRPVGRADLAEAQVACVRFREHAARRSPLTRKPWMRILITTLYGVAALSYIIDAFAAHSGYQHVFAVVMALLLATLAVLWATVIPHSAARQRDRMARLRRQLEDGYAR